MLKRLPSSALAILLTKSTSGRNTTPSISLIKVGILYIVAALCQLGWPSFLISQWDTTKKFMAAPGAYGWALTALWIGMGWCILHLIYIGIRMIQLSRGSDMSVYQTPMEKRRLGRIAFVLVLGVIADMIFIPMLFSAPDQTYAVMLAIAMAVRILQANAEAILQHHRM